MADWPDLDELKQVLNLTEEDGNWDGDSGDEAGTRLTRVLAAAIATVKKTVGYWEDDQDPTDEQAQAALRLAELIAIRPTAPVSSLEADPTYRTLLKGSRRAFGIA